MSLIAAVFLYELLLSLCIKLRNTVEITFLILFLNV